MLPILIAALVVIGVMGACPETPLGRTLRRLLVETPARVLARFSARRLIGPALLAGAGVVLVIMFEAEGLRLFAMAAPELVSWAVMFDLTVTLDLVAASLAMAGATRLKPLLARLRMTVRRTTATLRALPRRAARALRTRAIRQPRPTRKDDPEPFASYAFA